MKIEQIYTGCLSQGAYYIESNGEVAIIDPLRETKPYLERAEKDNAKIKYIFETHFHADFVSGHLTLAQQTDADIIYGPLANPSFKAVIATDGEVFKLGNITITAIHTPGHTMESTTYLLKDENGKDHAIFSGDTLFLGDVGRPDLAQKANEVTQEDLAGILFDSLRNKIMPLADDVIVYPAHGAGSACGKNMMKETVDTLGNQRKMNYALRADMTREEFIQEVTDGLAPPPLYFPMNVKMNREGYSDFNKVLADGTKPLSPEAFERLANETDAIVLDVRNQIDFIDEHIPRSIFIGLDGGFAPWVGALLADVQQKILLVVPPGREEEAVSRLSRVGFDNTIGYLEGGIEGWKAAGKEIDTVDSVDAEGLKEIIEDDLPVFDVRNDGEYVNGNLSCAAHVPLGSLNDYVGGFPSGNKCYLYCAGGYRSVIAASILKSRGIHNVVNIAGGFAAIKEAGIPIEA
ncbi:MBL fold metallo-hydrolase [Aequorivita viscosa]|uniref:Glyoxylase, beta-lactamase superfamily II n=1 Tax=Aequorivita viscosa TaxID=797419 RepID=A0A1M6P7P0_9FLAO|nr:rhodanese-like domain-containing protein [Aequorivita viscosa]SDW77543.1 Glyoxylase, beta-lactamase superfamily II [Aequorivita viscosa]SHK03954.1 Glyoxylase, beta-lactamase superfamily II [Aequorivita viscosa]